MWEFLNSPAPVSQLAYLWLIGSTVFSVVGVIHIALVVQSLAREYQRHRH